MKLRAIVILVALFATPVFAQTVDVPEDIQEMYAEYYGAIVVGDLEAAQAYMSTIARLQAHFAGQGRQGAVMRLGESWDLETLEPKFLRCILKDDMALVEYDLKIEGTDKATGEDAAETWRKSDTLMQVGGSWQIFESGTCDPERRERDVNDGLARDDEAGIEVPIPDGWYTNVATDTAQIIIAMTEPGLKTGAVVAAVDLPVRLSSKDLAEAEAKGRAPLLQALGIDGTTSEVSETTLAGRPAYVTTTEMYVEGMTVYQRRYHLVESTETGDVARILVLTSTLEDAFTRFKPQFDQILTGLKFFPPTDVELPPELGKIVDGKYVNPTHDVSLDIAEGWQAGISKSRFLFQVVLSPQEGKSTLLLGAVDVGQYVDPKLAMQGDLNLYRQRSPDFQIVGEGERDKGDIQGYQVLSEFSYADEGKRRRWQVMFMRDTILFFLIGEAVPAADYAKVADDWGAMVDSLNMGAMEDE